MRQDIHLDHRLLHPSTKENRIMCDSNHVQTIMLVLVWILLASPILIIWELTRSANHIAKDLCNERLEPGLELAMEEFAISAHYSNPGWFIVPIQESSKPPASTNRNIWQWLTGGIDSLLVKCRALSLLIRTIIANSLLLVRNEPVLSQ